MRALWLVMLAACGGASSDPGRDALLQVINNKRDQPAQFRPGGFPSANGGPDAMSLQPRHDAVPIGQFREPLTGVLAPGARAAVIGIDGLDGTWIVPAGVPDIETPDDPSVHATIGLSRAMPEGPFTLLLAAADADGHLGEPARRDVMAIAAAPSNSNLTITLTWNSSADLDLHVVDPLGGEAWSGHPNTWQLPPPGDPIVPDAWMTGGILDHDANADCTRDGVPEESVTWLYQAPPPGEYIVRVDARSLCSDGSAPWEVTADRLGTSLGDARGIATLDDVQRAPHAAGAGVLALRFTIP